MGTRQRSGEAQIELSHVGDIGLKMLDGSGLHAARQLPGES